VLKEIKTMDADESSGGRRQALMTSRAPAIHESATKVLEAAGVDQDEDVRQASPDSETVERANR
jgi:hypothetical protein